MCSRHLDDGPDREWSDAERLARYAALRLVDDAVVIYDMENETAWIQSGAARPVHEMA